MFKAPKPQLQGYLRRHYYSFDMISPHLGLLSDMADLSLESEPPEAGRTDELPLDATRIIKPDTSKPAPATAEVNKNATSKPKTRRLVVCIDGTSNQFSDKVIVASMNL